MKIRLDSWKQQVLRCCKCYFTPSTFSKAVHLFLPLNGQGSKARLELSGRAGRQDTPHWGGAVGDGGALGDLWSPESQVQRKYTQAPHPHRSASGGRGGRQQPARPRVWTRGPGASSALPSGAPCGQASAWCPRGHNRAAAGLGGRLQGAGVRSARLRWTVGALSVEGTGAQCVVPHGPRG